MTMKTSSLNVIPQFWSLTGESEKTQQFFMVLFTKGSRKEFSASQFHMHKHVVCLEGATIFGKGQS